MKITIKNANLTFNLNTVHFINLAGAWSSNKVGVTYTTSDDGTDIKSTAIEESGTATWAYASYRLTAAAVAERTYYLVMDIEVVNKNTDTFSAKFYQGTDVSMTYPTTRSIIGVSIAPKASGSGQALTDIVLQNGIKTPAGASEGAFEYIVHNVAVVDSTDCSFDDLDTCIAYIKQHGFNSVE